MSYFQIPSIETYDVDPASYNCFSSLTEADTYHGRRLNNTVWREADEDTRISALFNATDILNRLDWTGIEETSGQLLAFPRRFMPTRESTHRRDYVGAVDYLDYINVNTLNYVDSTSIPQFLKEATAELANYIIIRHNAGETEVSQSEDTLSSISLGGGALSLDFREGNSNASTTVDQPISNTVLDIIADFLVSVPDYSKNKSSTVTLMRS